jgi:putative transposase
MDEETKEKIALWRVGVLGPLVSARLEHGDRKKLFGEAAKLTFAPPDGQSVKLSPRTVEAWYYAWREGGFEALKPADRKDAGKSRVISEEMANYLITLKLDNPLRSVRRVIKIAVQEGKARKGELKRSTVHRMFQAKGISGRVSPDEVGIERRAYRHEHAGDLWMGDVMHGRMAIAENKALRKSYLHIFLDSATRYVPHGAFRFGEKAEDFEAVLKQAILKCGRPRALYVDKGAAQTSDSLRLICAELGIRLIHTRAYDPQSKAGIERMIRTIREEVESELPLEPLPIGELNSLLWSWIQGEYHRRIHSGTNRAPLEDWLSQAENLRPAPEGKVLDRIFLHRESRKVRKDGTVRFGGRLLEVRSELSGREVELRFEPGGNGRLPDVYKDGKFYCNTTELDLAANSRRKRYRPKVKPACELDVSGQRKAEPLKLIQEEHLRQIRSPKEQTDIKEE